MEKNEAAISEQYPEGYYIIADGFDQAILGVEPETERVIYSTGKCIEILETENGMDYEEAQEFFIFNVQGSYVGEHTPIWMEELL